MISRRALVMGLLFAPAIIRTPGLLMPIKPLVAPELLALVPGSWRGKSPDEILLDIHEMLEAIWKHSPLSVEPRLIYARERHGDLDDLLGESDG